MKIACSSTSFNEYYTTRKYTVKNCKHIVKNSARTFRGKVRLYISIMDHVTHTRAGNPSCYVYLNKKNVEKSKDTDSFIT